MRLSLSSLLLLCVYYDDDEDHYTLRRSAKAVVMRERLLKLPEVNASVIIIAGITTPCYYYGSIAQSPGSVWKRASGGELLKLPEVNASVIIVRCY